jgi:TATA-binding protein-associated factor Taf7
LQAKEQEEPFQQSEVIETLEFEFEDSEDSEDDEENEEQNESETEENKNSHQTMLKFLLELNRLPNHPTRGLLQDYFSQHVNSSNTTNNDDTTHRSNPEEFVPQRHLTDVEEFQEII